MITTSIITVTTVLISTSIIMSIGRYAHMHTNVNTTNADSVCACSKSNPLQAHSDLSVDADW